MRSLPNEGLDVAVVNNNMESSDFSLMEFDIQDFSAPFGQVGGIYNLTRLHILLAIYAKNKTDKIVVHEGRYILICYNLIDLK